MPIFYYFFERISLQRDDAKIYFQILTLNFAYYNCCIIFPFLAFCAKVPFIRKLLFSMTSHLSFAPSFFLGIHFFHSLSLEKKIFSSLISGKIGLLSSSRVKLANLVVGEQIPIQINFSKKKSLKNLVKIQGIIFLLPDNIYKGFWNGSCFFHMTGAGHLSSTCKLTGSRVYHFIFFLSLVMIHCILFCYL